MKRIKRIVAALTLACAFMFSDGSAVHVRADQTSGPQGQQDSKSKGPSTSSGSQQEAEFWLWLIILWLLGLL